MLMLLRKTLATLALPPASLILLVLAGWWLARRHPRLGRGMMLAGLAGLWLLSTPIVSDALRRSLEQYPPLALEQVSGAQAIVLLTAGAYHGAPEYGGASVPGGAGLERIRYAAWLARQTGLPLLVTGGRVHGEAEGSLARDMNVVLAMYGTPARWLEEDSRTTWENARNSAGLLPPGSRVLVVTHAIHMPRAMLSFEQAGLAPVAAPTVFVETTGRGPWLLRLLPSASALQRSAEALHEWAGLAWYRLAY